MHSISLSILKKLSVAGTLSAILLFSSISHAAEPLKIGYSDWPGWGRMAGCHR